MPDSDPDPNPDPRRGPIWRLGRAVVWLRFLVVPAWIAGAVLATSQLPSGLGSEAAELGSLLPRSSKAVEVEERSLRDLRLPADQPLDGRRPQGGRLRRRRRRLGAPLRRPDRPRQLGPESDSLRRRREAARRRLGRRHLPRLPLRRRRGRNGARERSVRHRAAAGDRRRNGTCHRGAAGRRCRNEPCRRTPALGRDRDRRPRRRDPRLLLPLRSGSRSSAWPASGSPTSFPTGCSAGSPKNSDWRSPKRCSR